MVGLVSLVSAGSDLKAEVLHFRADTSGSGSHQHTYYTHRGGHTYLRFSGRTRPGAGATNRVARRRCCAC